MKKPAILIAFLLIVTNLTLPSSAAELTRTETFIPETETYLGWPDFTPLTVSADGSFTIGEERIQFGYTTKIAQVTRPTFYPTTVHTFSDGNLFYNLQLFVNALTIEDTSCLVLYARLTVENLSEDDMAFPTVSTQLLSLTEVPENISSGEKVTCDFAVIADTGENALPAVDAEILGTFDDNMAAMETFWDTQLTGSFSFTQVPEEAEDFIYSLKTKYIDLLCAIPVEGDYELVSLLGQLPKDTSEMTCFDAALYFMKTEDSDFLDSVWENLQDRYAEICNALEPYVFTMSEQEEEVRLLPGENEGTALSDNLDALTEIKAFAYLSRTKDPEGESAVQAVYQELLSSVETVMRNTVSHCTSMWSATNLPGSLSEGIFSLSADSSAAAAVAWYKKDAVFATPGGGTYLKRLARQQLPYVQQEEPFSLANAVVSQLEDGTIVLGQGLSGTWLNEKDTISFENYPLQGGGTLDCTISNENGELHIQLSPSTPTGASLEFPVFLNNIEYASCGFDSENGIVSVPAGTTEITVRLEEDVETITQAYQNERSLEIAIAAYEGINLGEYTNYSVSLFSPALENAKAARTGPASEMLRTATELENAAKSLAKTRSGYTVSLYEENDAAAGDLEAEEICQVFTSTKAGTLEEIFVEGTFAEGITAVLYELQSDGYSTGELIGESRGTASNDGVLFQFSVELEAETGYLLAVFSESGTIRLPVYRRGQDVQILYSRDGEELTGYDLTCLGMSAYISQANLEDLDTFLETCLTTDISSYTRESRNRLETKMEAAKNLLCTQSVSEDEYTSVYNDLKDAFAALATYPSDAPVEETPAALYIVLGVALVLLIAGGIGSVAAYKKREW